MLFPADATRGQYSSSRHSALASGAGCGGQTLPRLPGPAVPLLVVLGVWWRVLAPPCQAALGWGGATAGRPETPLGASHLSSLPMRSRYPTTTPEARFEQVSFLGDGVQSVFQGR